MRRFILTGTPGSGKTAIIRQLELDGFSVVEEAATDVIALGRRGASLKHGSIPLSSTRLLNCKDNGSFERRARHTSYSFTIGRPSALLPWRSTLDTLSPRRFRAS